MKKQDAWTLKSSGSTYRELGSQPRTYDDKYKAAIDVAKRIIDANPHLYLEALQTSPITYKTVGTGCYYDGTFTDTSYMTYNYNGNCMSFMIKIYGYQTLTGCQTTIRRYSGYEGVFITAKPVCPSNYKLFRSVIDNVNEPFLK